MCVLPVEAVPIPCSPLKQLPVSVHDLCEGDVAGVEAGGKLTQLTRPALAYLTGEGTTRLSTHAQLCPTPNYALEVSLALPDFFRRESGYGRSRLIAGRLHST